MAKQTNIIAYLRNEVAKGNTIIQSNGVFANEEKATRQLKDEYLKALKADEIDMDTTFSQFKEDKMKGMTKTEDILKIIAELIDNEPKAFESAAPLPEQESDGDC